MHTALKNLAVVGVPAVIQGVTDFDTGGPAALGIDRFDVGPGWLPSVRSEQICLLILMQPDPARLTLRRNDRSSEIILQPGGMTVIPANEHVSIRWHTALKTLAIWIEPITLRDFIEGEMHSLAIPEMLGAVETLYDPELAYVATQMESALCRGGPGHAVILDALSSVFLALLVRNHGLCQGDGGAEGSARLARGKLRALRAHIADNLSRRISIAELADIAGLSESSLYREMRELTGTTPAEFILRTRIRIAHRMVRDSALPLKQIAAECGFSDQAHLSRTFKKYYGLPPRVMRISQPARDHGPDAG